MNLVWFSVLISKLRWNVLLSHRYLQEYSALGTGGGIYHFRDQIVAGGPEAFFVMNADVCSAFPLADMLRFQKEHGEPNSFVILGTTVRVPNTHRLYWILRCFKIDFLSMLVQPRLQVPFYFISPTGNSPWIMAASLKTRKHTRYWKPTIFHLVLAQNHDLTFIFKVLHYVEKPSTFVSDIINCGVYLFTPDIFQHIGTVFQKNQQDMLLWVETPGF